MGAKIIMKKIISKGEETADNIYSKTKFYLPFIARLFLLSTFIQENLTKWEEVIGLLKTMEFEKLIEGLLLTVCFTIGVLGIIMVLLQKGVPIACLLLFFTCILDMCMMGSIPGPSTFFINGSILGSLLILVAESQEESRSLFATVPTVDRNTPKDFIKLGGRCLLIFMFINFTSLEPSLLLILKDFLGLALMNSVLLGYKTKLGVLVSIVYFNTINFCENNWWTVPDEFYRGYLKYRFCQVLSVTGGLLMIVLYGPGRLTFDEAKKRM